MRAININSSNFYRELRIQARKLGVHPPREYELRYVAELVESYAIEHHNVQDVFIRYGHHGDTVVVDLGQTPEQLVVIGPDGWQIQKTHPAKFAMAPGMEALPLPEPGGTLEEFRTLMQLSEETWKLILAFMLNCMNPRGPYFILMLEGGHGSGKSLLASFIRQLIDPCSTPSESLPDDERNLMITANQTWLLNFDNISGFKRDMSDALCRLATGAGFKTRRLYANDEMCIFKTCRPMIMNGITTYANFPDLRDRAIFVDLPSIPENRRKTERQLRAEFEAMRPRLLGALFDGVSAALRCRDEVTPPGNVRMMDAAEWILGAERGLNYPQGYLIDAIVSAKQEKELEVLDTDLVFREIVDRLPTMIAHFGNRVDEGYTRVGLLHETLANGGHNVPLLRAVPTPKNLTDHIKRHGKSWLSQGLKVEHGPKCNKGRKIILTAMSPLKDDEDFQRLLQNELNKLQT